MISPHEDYRKESCWFMFYRCWFIRLVASWNFQLPDLTTDPSHSDMIYKLPLHFIKD